MALPNDGINVPTYLPTDVYLLSRSFRESICPQAGAWSKKCKGPTIRKTNLAPKWIHAGRHLTLDIRITNSILYCNNSRLVSFGL